MGWNARKNWLQVVALLIGISLGASAGLGGYAFYYAKGASYLTNDPAACINCHVMRDQYNGWTKSSHHAVAVCNDCHAPHSFLPKYWVKARNGFWHSFYFTSGNFPEPIQISATNLAVTEKACRHCHGAIVHAMAEPVATREPVRCTHCHASVGHLR